MALPSRLCFLFARKQPQARFIPRRISSLLLRAFLYVLASPVRARAADFLFRARGEIIEISLSGGSAAGEAGDLREAFLLSSKSLLALSFHDARRVSLSRAYNISPVSSLLRAEFSPRIAVLSRRGDLPLLEKPISRYLICTGISPPSSLPPSSAISLPRNYAIVIIKFAVNP